MSADNYLFIDRETFRVFHRFMSAEYGRRELRERMAQAFALEGSTGAEAIVAAHEETPAEQPVFAGNTIEEALDFCEEFGWTEYGIQVGALCPGTEMGPCGEQVDQQREGGYYPRCGTCGLFEVLREAIREGQVERALELCGELERTSDISLALLVSHY